MQLQNTANKCWVRAVGESPTQFEQTSQSYNDLFIATHETRKNLIQLLSNNYRAHVFDLDVCYFDFVR